MQAGFSNKLSIIEGLLSFSLFIILVSSPSSIIFSYFGHIFLTVLYSWSCLTQWDFRVRTNSVGWRLLSWKSRRDETTYRTSNRKNRIPKVAKRKKWTRNAQSRVKTIKKIGTYVSSVMSFEYANVPYVSSGSNNLVEETGEFFRLKFFYKKKDFE